MFVNGFFYYNMSLKFNAMKELKEHFEPLNPLLNKFHKRAEMYYFIEKELHWQNANINRIAEFPAYKVLPESKQTP